MTHVVPPPKKKYPISAEAARKARRRAALKAAKNKAGPTNPYVSRKGTYYDQRIQRCKCESKAWHVGEGTCGRCGKAL